MSDVFLESGAAQWGLDPDAFARAHAVAAAKGGPLPAHLADFALAVACAEGLEPAWDHLVTQLRPRLDRAAAALDPAGRAVDLAEELFADLYSQKLFRYFHGRSSLSTWLRAILAQRFVDRLRSTRRTGELVEDVPAVVRDGGPGDSTCRAAVRLALAAAIAGLPPRDRLMLGCYYTQGLKLAAIGRLFREHEATTSRHLTRIRLDLRAAIEASLTGTAGFDDDARRDCLRSVMDDAGDLDLEAMITPAPGLRPTGARSTPRIVHTERDRAAD
jgi:RNA polymerase sigma-70 factor (ECF subfamily)